MKFALTAVALACCCLPSPVRGQDNPFKSAKVGDWVEYKMTSTQMGVTLDSKLKWEVAARDDKEVLVKPTMVVSDRGKVKSVNAANNEFVITDRDGKDRTITVDKITKVQLGDKEVGLADLKAGNDVTVNKEYPGPDIKIDLSKPYDPITAANLPPGAGAKVEKDGDGMESVTIGKKEWPCSFVKLKLSAMVMGGDFASELKVWTSKDVPLAGMVKLEAKSQTFEVILELAGSGGK